MKIHKINKEGTIAVVIPKDMAEMLGWKDGQDVIVTPGEEDYVIKLTNKTLKDSRKQC